MVAAGFRGAVGRRRGASELPGRRVGWQLPQGSSPQLGHRLGQGDRRQRIDADRLGHLDLTRAASRAPSKSSTKTQEADAQPKTETLKITTSSRRPVSTTQSVTSTASPSATASVRSAPPRPTARSRPTTVRITSTGGGSCTGRLPAGSVGGGGGVLRRARAVAVPKSSCSGWGRAGHRRAVLIGARRPRRHRWRRRRLGRGRGAAARLPHGHGDPGRHRTTLTVVGSVAPVTEAAAAFQVGGKVTSVSVTPGPRSPRARRWHARHDRAERDGVLRRVGRSVPTRRSSPRTRRTSRAPGPRPRRDHRFVLHGCEGTAVFEPRPRRRPRHQRRHRLGRRASTRSRKDQNTLTQDEATLSKDQQQGGGRSGPGADRLHQRQHQHADGSGHLRERPADRLGRRAAGLEGPDDGVQGRDGAGAGPRGRVVRRFECRVPPATRARSAAHADGGRGFTGNTGNTGAGTGGTGRTGSPDTGGGTSGSGETDTPEQIASDQAAIDTAQANLTEAQQSLTEATLTQPDQRHGGIRRASTSATP